LAFCGQVVNERLGKAFERLVPLDHDAVRFLQALSQGLTCIELIAELVREAVIISGLCLGRHLDNVWWNWDDEKQNIQRTTQEGNPRISLHEPGIGALWLVVW
jgi:phage gp29-like protein